MRFDISDNTFREKAASWLTGLDDATICDLKSVFAISPGYYPTTLYELWQVEVKRRGLPVRPPERRQRSVRRVLVSHPLDCDWRFTTETTTDLLGRAIGHVATGGCIAHLGTPSTFLTGCQLHGSYQHVLLERNAAMTGSLVDATGLVITIGLATHEPPAINADAAILDPPWYPTDTLTFLTASSRLCRNGALMWLCQPTLATRPGVTDERAALLAELPRLGLASVDAAPGALRYQMPHFEAMSLRLAAAELTISAAWRTGDLLTLRKIGPVMNTATSTSNEQWSEVRFGPVRIKLRATGTEKDLSPLVPGDVLDTVSRRDPVRKHIGFWTSGNRVYGIVDPETVGRLIELCNGDLESMQFTVARTLNHAKQLGMSSSTARRLFDVLLVELQEHHAWEESA